MAEPAPDQHALNIIRISQLYMVGMASIYAWDVVTTFHTEWQRIWVRNWGMGNWNIIKAFFIANRYGMLVEMVISLKGWTGTWSEAACHRYVKVEPGWGLVPHTAADTLLLLRTWTFCRRRKPILAFLTLFLVANTAIRIAAIAEFVAVPLWDEGSTIHACIASGPPGGRSLVLLFWVLPFVYTACIALMTMVQSVLNHWSHHSDTPFFTALHRDGIVYILCIFAVELLNALFFAQRDTAIQAINVPLTIAITSMMCSRIVLQLWSEPTAFLPDFSNGANSSQAEKTAARGSVSSRSGAGHSRSQSAQDQLTVPRIGMHTVVETDEEEVMPYDKALADSRDSTPMNKGSPPPGSDVRRIFNTPSPPAPAHASHGNRLAPSPPTIGLELPFRPSRSSSGHSSGHAPATFPPDYRDRDLGSLV